MASFRPPFPGMFKQNAPRHGFNMNFRGERPPMQNFQRAPNPSFRPFQSPDRFPHGNFQNRPRFSNFPDHTFSVGFRNRPPAPENMPPVNGPHPAFRPRFSGPFELPFRPWNHRQPFAPPIQHFQNRPRAPIPPPQERKSRNPSVQANKKKKQKTKEFRKLKSWMTDELFAEVKKKNTLYLKAKSSDEQSAWQEFRLQRNRVSSLIKEAKIKAGLISRKVKEEDNKEKPFSCDTCDRAFVTENELDDHLSQHVKCDITNCKFEAHPKIVALHQKMQHDTGYADVINKLQDNEEIQKWREERRKNFPTAENIEKRKAEQAEKEARGEVLETKEFGKFKRRRPEDGNLMNDHRRKRVRHFQNTYPGRESAHYHPISRPFIFNIDSESDSDSDSHITLKQFSGLLSLKDFEGVNKENSSFETGSSSCFKDSITISDHHSAPNQGEHTLPYDDFDKDLAVQSIESNAANVKDLAQTTILINNNLMERKASEDVAISILAAEKITVVKERKMTEDIVNPVPEVEKNMAVKERKTAEDIVNPVSEVENIMAMKERKMAEDIVNPVTEVEKIMAVKDTENVKKDPETLTAAVEESDDEAPTSVPIVKSTLNEISAENNKAGFQDLDETRKHSESDKGQDEKSAISKGLSEASSAKNRNKNPKKQYTNSGSSHKYTKSENNNSRKWPEPVLKTRKSTLLEKLLADDIRHERNVILQCIRHIVNNNFFGIGEK